MEDKLGSFFPVKVMQFRFVVMLFTMLRGKTTRRQKVSSHSYDASWYIICAKINLTTMVKLTLCVFPKQNNLGLFSYFDEVPLRRDNPTESMLEDVK